MAGLQTAISLARRGVKAVVIEKEASLGGKLCSWHQLFPTRTPAAEVLGGLLAQVKEAGIECRTSSEVIRIETDGVKLRSGETIASDATVVCSGFDLFDARIKEEYGYGIYDNVFTSADLERMFNQGRVATSQGTAPRRVALLHCVGSRDQKIGQGHCSKVCCITGVKQAVELKEMFPEAEIYNFYMDIRMFGCGYEEMYRRAQIEHNINFIRGRISEASPTIDNRIQIKAEDTLLGRPLKMTVDMLILLIGMHGGCSNEAFAATEGVTVGENGFLEMRNPFAGNVSSGANNIFYAGAVTAPKSVGESLNEGVAAAERVAEYLNTI